MPERASVTASRRSPSPGQMRCPNCGGTFGEVFFESQAVPVHCNILFPTPDAARRAQRGDIRLALCQDCGLIFNTAFDESLVTYDDVYENSLHCSPLFEAYAEALARDLAARVQLKDRLVVEVGCGKGEFLRRLCEIANARGLGIDASYDPDIDPGQSDDGVQFVREPFTSLPRNLTPALVFCRHVLEHVPDPRSFMAELASAAGRSPDGRVFIEVPNALWTLRDLGIWDIIYEHCSYFSPPALRQACRAVQLAVDRVYSTFGEQFLCVEASVRLAETPTDETGDLERLAHLAARFAEEYRETVRRWEARLRELCGTDRRLVLWGAGSKGITFVNTVAGAESVSALVDINPRKHGRFVPGTGQPVVAPQALHEIRPAAILAMNPIYREEIEGLLASSGIRCPIETAN